MNRLLAAIALVLVLVFVFALALAPVAGAQSPPNVILILSDDHRYDFMGFMESAPPWLETPQI
ncbi:MAG TPA: hypothetical protein VNQ14_08920, partial [Woeseiaceae bacterium]|nr:hypothetical protein [Woeseiaceae bacterium]